MTNLSWPLGTHSGPMKQVVVPCGAMASRLGIAVYLVSLVQFSIIYWKCLRFCRLVVLFESTLESRIIMYCGDINIIEDKYIL